MSLTRWVYMSLVTVCFDFPLKKRKGSCCGDSVEMPPEAEIRGKEQNPSRFNTQGARFSSIRTRRGRLENNYNSKERENVRR